MRDHKTASGIVEEITESEHPQTLYDKRWARHVVREEGDGDLLLYIDQHLCHEVTSPQAFEGKRLAGRRVRRPEKTAAVIDHNVPTTGRNLPIAGGTGYVVEFTGSAFRSLSMEGRMTVCNMAIEMGARSGLIAPDRTTFDYLRGKPGAFPVPTISKTPMKRRWRPRHYRIR